MNYDVAIPGLVKIFLCVSSNFIGRGLKHICFHDGEAAGFKAGASPILRA
jgi:hypothetical protein